MKQFCLCAIFAFALNLPSLGEDVEPSMQRLDVLLPGGVSYEVYGFELTRPITEYEEQRLVRENSERKGNDSSAGTETEDSDSTRTTSGAQEGVSDVTIVSAGGGISGGVEASAQISLFRPPQASAGIHGEIHGKIDFEKTRRKSREDTTRTDKDKTTSRRISVSDRTIKQMSETTTKTSDETKKLGNWFLRFRVRIRNFDQNRKLVYDARTVGRIASVYVVGEGIRFSVPCEESDFSVGFDEGPKELMFIREITDSLDLDKLLAIAKRVSNRLEGLKGEIHSDSFPLFLEGTTMNVFEQNAKEKTRTRPASVDLTFGDESVLSPWRAKTRIRTSTERNHAVTLRELLDEINWSFIEDDDFLEPVFLFDENGRLATVAKQAFGSVNVFSEEEESFFTVPLLLKNGRKWLTNLSETDLNSPLEKDDSYSFVSVDVKALGKLSIQELDSLPDRERHALLSVLTNSVSCRPVWPALVKLMYVDGRKELIPLAKQMREQAKKDASVTPTKDILDMLGELAQQDDPVFQYQRGLNALQSKNFEKAAQYFKIAADAGNLEAMNALGVRYQRGEGVSRDGKQAVYWYKQAAERGNLDAMFNLGLAYQSGISSFWGSSPKDAFKWFLAAATNGHERAQLKTADCYWHGEGVSRNETEAVRWYRPAAEKGNTNAIWKIASHYRLTKPPQEQQALEWYRRLAEKGNAEAQYWAGRLCLHGKDIVSSIPQDDRVKEAVHWLVRSAAGGLPKSKDELETLLDNASEEESVRYKELIRDEISIVEMNPDLRRWFEGISNNQQPGLDEYECGMEREKAGDLVSAFLSFKISSEKGFHKGQNALGDCYWHGKGIGQDQKTALEWYKKAAEGGNADSQFSLGYAYRYGYGTTVNQAESRKWLEKAAKQGHEKAKRFLDY